MNNSLSKKIGILLVIIIVAFIGQVGVNTLGIKQMNDSNVEITDYHMMKNELIHIIEGSLNEAINSLYLHQISESDEVMLEQEEKINSNLQTMGNTIKQYQELIATEEERSLMDSISTQQKKFSEDILLALEYSIINEDEKSLVIIEEQLQEQMSQMDETITSLVDSIRLGIDEATKQQDYAYIKAIIRNVISVIVVLVVVTFNYWILITKSINPIKRAHQQLEIMIDGIKKNQGDLSMRLPVESSDEAGKLIEGLNLFVETLEEVILGIRGASKVLEDNIGQVTYQIGQAHTNMNENSEAIEALSSSMEEMTATAEDVKATTNGIYDEMLEVAENAKKGTEYTRYVREQAEITSKETLTSKNTMTQMMQEMTRTLTASIEDSKRVEQIDELTNNILNITAQTNLLALNASIEAARAGEAGKGFAVVAEEIRVLAENSKETANGIQEISAMVKNAVEMLSTNAREMINFMNQTVVEDYNKFAMNAEQFNKAALDLDEILLNFESKSQSLQGVTQNVAVAVNAISTTIEESTKDILHIVGNTVEITKAMEIIDAEIKETENITNDLGEQVNRFK